MREQLIAGINKELTTKQKHFLVSFKSRNPNWSLLGIEGADELPAVHWKMQNLVRMPNDKHTVALELLRAILHISE